MQLVIESATAACSVALIDGDSLLGELHEIVGRGHAERLVPMIEELLAGRRPHAIMVDCGPGSFTGLRVGLAAAHGLAIGWGVPLTGYSSMAAVAQDGGDIVYRGFRQGTVFLAMQGACSGCPSSTATLKQGIEGLLKHYVPEVETVEAV